MHKQHQLGIAIGVKTLLATVLCGTLLSAQAIAQDYPSGPVTLVVPFAAGGASDTVGRLVAESLSERLGQPVVVDNRPGAGGITATTYVLNREADGHTLMLSTSSKTVVGVLQPDITYDPLNDLTTLSPIASIPTILVVPTSFGVTDFEEFKEFVSQEGQRIVWGSPGTGNAPHISTETMLSELGAEATQIAYASSSAMHPDLIEGRLHFTIDSLSAIKPHLTSGAVTPIAVIGHSRLKGFPDIPTLGELGLDAFNDTLFDGWNSIDVSAEVDPSIAATLNEHLADILQDTEFQERLAQLDMVAFEPMDIQKAAEFVNTTSVTVGAIVESFDIQ